jgi:sugar transferase (PEP-CTERM/EpsH1 system associated)
MRILWVKAGGLVPPDTGGKIRSYNILSELARKHSVTCFLFYATHENDVHSELETLFDQSICIPLDLPRPKSFGELCDYGAHLFSRTPYNIRKFCRPRVRQELRRLLHQAGFDVIVCDFLVAAGVIPWDSPTPKVIFTHNVEAMIWRRHYEVASNPLWKALSWREWRAMKAAERKYLARADHVLTVSENDRAVFNEYVETARLSVIPTGADTEYFAPSVEPEIPGSLVFTGSMDWLPNEDGILHFIKETLPLIRQEEPEVSVCIVGRNPSPRLRQVAAREKKLEVTGRVEDIRPFLVRSQVCIVPLRIGGGTRLKIFEAMSMGKAVVSTRVGAEGLPVRNGEHLLLADDSESFARSTVNLLRDASRRRQIGLAARKLVEENYSWRQVARVFSNVLEDVVAGSRSEGITS